ncbi:CPCC family cysteine-rich protein [Kitasatospora sp. NPDC056184]|uniref:CPCC family cysteine-rich protein n=1 Tax=Kitasatospora sp. NPDC056184 TaxID=3345738 RepID=UPI0035E26DA0
MDTKCPCTCCGHLVFEAADGWPGSYGICPVCSWEDDPERLLRPVGRAHPLPGLDEAAGASAREPGDATRRARTVAAGHLPWIESPQALRAVFAELTALPEAGGG